jgi:hypothetical protein
MVEIVAVIMGMFLRRHLSSSRSRRLSRALRAARHWRQRPNVRRCRTTHVGPARPRGRLPHPRVRQRKPTTEGSGARIVVRVGHGESLAMANGFVAS